MHQQLVAFALVGAGALIPLHAAAPASSPDVLILESTVPGRPVEFTITGQASPGLLTAPRLSMKADTIVASTPARLQVSDAALRIAIRVRPGEPWLRGSFAAPLNGERVEAWGDEVTLRRDTAGASLQIVAPALHVAH